MSFLLKTFNVASRANDSEQVLHLDTTKAGMEFIDKSKIDQIINDVSKGSKFYKNEERKLEKRRQQLEYKLSGLIDVKDVLSKAGKINKFPGNTVDIHCFLQEDLKKFSVTRQNFILKCIENYGILEAKLLRAGTRSKVISTAQIFTDIKESQLQSFPCYIRIPAVLGIFCHIDMDMFFAAIHEKMSPGLKDVPMAVGDYAMLSTSNYRARLYGVRAAMPGYIAKKLCPHLVIVEANYTRYMEESCKVKNVISVYDNNYVSGGIDEVSMDLLPYLLRQKINQSSVNGKFGATDTYDVVMHLGELLHDAADIVKKIRESIVDVTKLTASAGIACTRSIAKAVSNFGKPNGQYLCDLPHFLFDVAKENNDSSNHVAMNIFRYLQKDVIWPMSCRKISGIGSATEFELSEGFNVKIVHDIFVERYLLYSCYSRYKFFEWLLSCTLALQTYYGSYPGSILYKDENDECDERTGRKSLSVSRTFKPRSLEQFISVAQKLANKAGNELINESLVFRQVTLVLKSVNYKTNQYSSTFPCYVTVAPDNVHSDTDSTLEDELLSSPQKEEEEQFFLGLVDKNVNEAKKSIIWETVESLLKPFYENYENYRLLGIRIGMIIPAFRMKCKNIELSGDKDKETRSTKVLGKGDGEKATVFDMMKELTKKKFVKKGSAKKKKISFEIFSSLSDSNTSSVASVSSNGNFFLTSNSTKHEVTPKKNFSKKIELRKLEEDKTLSIMEFISDSSRRKRSRSKDSAISVSD